MNAEQVPSPLLVLGAVASVQCGAGLAKTLFDDIGAGGTVFLRMGIAALVLCAIWRPRMSRDPLLIAFGVSLAGMNYAFYESLDRIPLGVAVTFEFVGPLGVAVALSRRWLDAVWVLLAASGILLLADLDRFDSTGVALALLAGAFWAAYILLSARVGRAFPGGGGLAAAMVFATVALVPFGVPQLELEAEPLLLGAAVALLASAIPYSLELEALRRLPERVFGVLMSLEPAMAALVGFVVLSERLGARELVGIALVVTASAGAAGLTFLPWLPRTPSD